jgi:hypothetical protein
MCPVAEGIRHRLAWERKLRRKKLQLTSTVELDGGLESNLLLDVVLGNGRLEVLRGLPSAKSAEWGERPRD